MSLRTLERRAFLAEDLQPPPRHGPPPGPCHLQLVMGNAPYPSRFGFTSDSLLGHQRFWVVTTHHWEPFLLPNREEDAPCQLHSGGFKARLCRGHTSPPECSLLGPSRPGPDVSRVLGRPRHPVPLPGFAVGSHVSSTYLADLL